MMPCIREILGHGWMTRKDGFHIAAVMMPAPLSAIPKVLPGTSDSHAVQQQWYVEIRLLNISK